MILTGRKLFKKAQQIVKNNIIISKILLFLCASFIFYFFLGNLFLSQSTYDYFFLILSLIGTIGFTFGRKFTTLLVKERLMYGALSIFTAFQICGYELFFVKEINRHTVEIFFAIIIWTYYMLTGFSVLVHRMQVRFVVDSVDIKRDGKKIFVIVFGIIGLMELIMLLAYYPGIYSYDSMACYKSALNLLQERSDIHSFLYICLIALCTKVSVNCIVLVIICAIAFSLTFASFMTYLYKKGLHKIWVIGATVLFCLMPNNAYMTISVWKDIPFTISLLSLTHALSRWVLDNDRVEHSAKYLTHIVMSVVFVALFRSNGMVVPFGLVLIFGIWGIKRKNDRKVFFALILAGILVLGIKGPIFSILDVQGTPEGFASIPFVDAVWANAYADVELPNEIRRGMEELFPYENWEQEYREGRSNIAIWDANAYNSLKLKEPLQWYCWCLVHSPKITIQNRLIKTDFLWSYFGNRHADFTFNCVFDELQNNVILERGASEWNWYHFDSTHWLRRNFQKYIDLFDKKLQILYRGGIHLTIWLLLCVEAFINKKRRVFGVVLPILFSTLALMIGSCYADYRYIWGMEIMTWFILPVYMLAGKEQLEVLRENEKKS